MLKKHGITASTPSNILLGAGTYYRGLQYTTADGWTGTILGATSGGGKVSIKHELKDLEIDGALVKFKGQTIKQGGTATMEVSFAEVTEELLGIATFFENSGADGDHDYYLDKARIEEGDYIQNLGFVGEKADGSGTIMVIFDYALCTSGLEIEAKGKEQSVIKLTFEAVSDPTQALHDRGNLDILPVTIYM